MSVVEQDSRRIVAGSLFAAVRGSEQDGHAYLSDAAARGARAALGEGPAQGPLPYLVVRDARRAVAILAERAAGSPSRRLEVVGITGTNGKTTTSFLLQSIWEACGIPSAVLGTLGSGRPDRLRAATHTTPDAPRFQGLLADLEREGARAVAAEISSHALDQDRTYGTRFHAVVFTNLTRDHLDYHQNFEAYRDAKAKLFHAKARGSDPAAAVVNLDDPATPAILEGSEDRILGYGTAAESFVRLLELRTEPAGVNLSVDTPRGRREIRTPLIGAYNGWNVLASYATALALELPIEKVEEALRRGASVPGRMERIDAGQPFLVLVDYAHTPDALARALAALRPFTRASLAVVFGCGGDRDHGKRPQMGAVAAREADRIVLTSDNPRREDPLAILRAIEQGVRAAGRAPDAVEPDRARAIALALGQAGPGDVVLIAGKGHEDYQETSEGRRPFDDRDVARRALATLGFAA
jgi:UDP-N-acetylmuramoyl-L-alanyl-D-glutamate--2,6-diaminopimelate ligase